jgi:hypothetical protein
MLFRGYVKGRDWSGVARREPDSASVCGPGQARYTRAMSCIDALPRTSPPIRPFYGQFEFNLMRAVTSANCRGFSLASADNPPRSHQPSCSGLQGGPDGRQAVLQDGPPDGGQKPVVMVAPG